LDLFAGDAENRSRDTDDEVIGSARRVLDVSPPFTRVCLFDLPGPAARLEAELRRRHPTRSGIKVYAGDCNLQLMTALNELARAGIRWAPTFAFVDQYDCEVQWQTLERIAAFRRGRTKAEMWIFFGTSFYGRGLKVRKAAMNAKYGEDLTAMFGCDDWIPIVRALRDEVIPPAVMRAEMVNLMRWRLQEQLGYRESHAFTMKNTNGSDIYDMIFVSDHEVGVKAMCHLYGKALHEQGSRRTRALLKRRDERRRTSGVEPLFGHEALLPAATAVTDAGRLPAYSSEPPVRPYGSRRGS
jgi:three-Cys-motif partner protein